MAGSGKINQMSLPKWVTANTHSLRDEAADYVSSLLPNEDPPSRCVPRGGEAGAGAPDAARLLERVEPLPESSERALARLRAALRGAMAPMIHSKPRSCLRTR